VIYGYGDGGRDATVFYDWTELHERRLLGLNGDKTLSLARLIDLSGTGYQCAMNYTRNGSAVTRQTVVFTINTNNLASAKFHYSYGASFALTMLAAEISDRVLKPIGYERSAETGRVTKMGMFVFGYPRIRRETVRDANVEITREADRYGRQTDVWYRFNNYVVFMLEVKYDTMGRVHQWRREVSVEGYCIIIQYVD